MSAYVKNVSRTILNNFRRYFAMVLITALGVAFFVGLRSTSPDMNYTLDSYFDGQSVYDLRLMTSLGLTEEQAATIAATPGVESAHPAYYCDMFITLGSGSSLARLHSLDLGADGAVNTPQLITGRFPEAPDECLIEERYLAIKGVELGDIVTVSTGDDEPLEDTLYNGVYRIVGAVESPVYISPTLGSSSKGSGTLDTYMYIPAGNFVSEIYTEIYLRLEDAEQYSRFSAEYDDFIEPVVDAFKQSGEVMAQERYDDIMDEGGQKIADGKQEIADAKSKLADAELELNDAYDKISEGEQELTDKTEEFYREIADAELELKDAEQKIADAWQEIADAKQELADGKADLQELKDGMRELADELGLQRLNQIPAKMQENLDLFFEGEQALADARSEIKDGWREIYKNKKLLEQGGQELAANAGALDYARQQLAGLETQLDGVQAGMEQIRQMCGDDANYYPDDVKAQWEQLETAEAQLQGGVGQISRELATADAARTQIESGWQRIGDGEEELREGSKEWQKGVRTLEQERKSLEELAEKLEIASIEELPQGIQELLDKIPEAEKEIADGEKELADAEKTLAEKTLEYEDGLRELEEGRAEGLEGIAEGEEKIADAKTELADGMKEYEDAKAEADEKLPDAERDIADAEKKLNELDEPKSYVLGLDSNIGFASFKQDSDRIDKISQYFPLIFFLVATLVSFTSMVRVVEYDRPTIGALKSLGYGAAAIIWKYVFFALAVCIPGCGIGIVIGYRFFPAIIFNQGYKIMYMMPSILTPLHLRFCALAFVISLLSVLIPTIAVCSSELSGSPAVLLRPKPPRSGKRVFLERVPAIWNRLSFSTKVTARNILRYKKRFFMTVTGVAGCTAILLTGFGLRDSIGVIARNQFGSVFLYDLEITFKENSKIADIASLENFLRDDARVNGYLYRYKDSCDCSSGAETQDVTVCVPESVDDFTRFVNLKDPDSGKLLQLDDGGAVITQKLAKLLHIGAGDEITLTDGDSNDFKVGVTGVVENYVAHYVYMSAEGYLRVFGEEAEANGLFCIAPGLDVDAESEISTGLLLNEAVTGTSFVSKVRDYYIDMVDSLNVVVLVLVTAGALLSFIVLFSLTGINIDERQRELATLKVLGFYERETAMYIFRENIVSTLIGTIAGLPAGIALHRFVMTTAEVDLVMFGRQIQPLSFLATSALSFLFLALVNWVMGFHIKKIDMIESLKSVE